MNAIASRLIACGNKSHGRTPGFQHHHESVAQVRRCFATEGGIWSVEDGEMAEAYSETYDPDADYERHLEDAGWHEARAQEAHEAAMGIEQFPVPAPAPQPEQPTLPVEAKPDFQGLPDGTYTVEHVEGHKTFEVKTQKADAKFAPGKRILSVLIGPDNEADYVGIGFVSTDNRGIHHLGPWKKFQSIGSHARDAAQMLLDDPREALVAGRCARCRRLLTTPESLERGLGETCAGLM